jgi:hypothetical protein
VFLPVAGAHAAARLLRCLHRLHAARGCDASAAVCAQLLRACQPPRGTHGVLCVARPISKLVVTSRAVRSVCPTRGPRRGVCMVWAHEAQACACRRM